MKSYIHIYKETRDRIMRGDLKPGTKLPSHRNICEDYAVSIPTVTKAINRLKREGLVSSIRGLGTMVADAPHSGGLVGTKTVVFVSFFPNFIHEVSSYALQEVFQGTDWRINARCTHSNLDWYRDYLIECREYPPAGMIWLPMSPYIYDHTEEMLPHPATKVVMISHEIPGRKYDLVRANGFADGFSLAEFLVDKGYDRDFIFLTEAPVKEMENSKFLQGLQKGFADRRIAFGLGQVRRFDNPHSYGFNNDPIIDGYNYTRELLKKERPRVIIAGHDWNTVSAYRAVRDAGLDVPGDIAVVSCETTVNLNAVTATPKLTALDTMFYYRARTAAEILKRRLEGDDSPVTYYETQSRIREGETT